MALGKSFINNKKSRGPRTEPCGTPYFNSLHDGVKLNSFYSVEEYLDGDNKSEPVVSQ
jgi:hypothetical protein